MDASKAWLIALGVALIASTVAVVILTVKVASLDQKVDSANERADQAKEDALAEVEDTLADTKSKLRDARKSLRNAQAPPTPSGNLQEQLDNGTAVPDPGLSASLPRKFWTCVRYVRDDCHSLKDDVVFKNDTQTGSAVTCLFDITYEDGATTSFTWSSEYVPPGGGTDTQVLYFYSDYSSPIDVLGTPDDCYRGVAQYSSGIGD